MSEIIKSPTGRHVIWHCETCDRTYHATAGKSHASRNGHTIVEIGRYDRVSEIRPPSREARIPVSTQPVALVASAGPPAALLAGPSIYEPTIDPNGQSVRDYDAERHRKYLRARFKALVRAMDQAGLCAWCAGQRPLHRETCPVYVRPEGFAR